MANPTCVVTGASSGIGLATCVALARQGARVVMVCRPSPHVRAAVAEVSAVQSAGQSPVVVEADLSRVSDMTAAGEKILRACTRLDVVVHNAGLWPMSRTLTSDGFEQAFAVNHLAPFVLNEQLLPHLAKAGRGRIVQVTAGLYDKGRIDFAATPRGDDFHRLRTYANTKLWNLLATLELARQHVGTGITINAVHPGVVRTRLGASKSLIGAALWLVKRLWLSPQAGAQGPTHLALADELEGQTGLIYNRLAVMPPAPVAKDEALARQVVEQTRRLLAAI